MTTHNTHPWQAEWTAALQRIADPARFNRGRSYVTLGAVLDVTIAPGHMSGQVHGSRRHPYETEIRAPKLGVSDLLQLPLAHLAELLTHRASPDILAKVIADMPDIIPPMSQVEFYCSCPDWGDPCKHAVATALYFGTLMTDTLDSFLTFRGLDHVTLVEAMMHHARHPKAARDRRPRPPQPVATPPPVPTARANEPAPRHVDSRQFWEGHALPHADSFHIGQGPNEPPEWVLYPPLPWPTQRGMPTYLEIMCTAYDKMRDALNEKRDENGEIKAG